MLLAVGEGREALVSHDLAVVEHLLRALGDPRRGVRAEHFRRRPAEDRLRRRAALLGEMAVGEEEAAVAVEVGDGIGNIFGVEAQLRFLRLDGAPQLVVGLDVEQHDEDAEHGARAVAVGNHVAADAARLASRPKRVALVGDRLAREGAFDERHRRGAHFRGHHGRDRLADRVARAPRPFAARAVGEADHAVAVDVGDGEADRIHEERELALALGERRFGILDLLDVHQHHEHAEDRAGLAVERQIMGAHPLPGARSLEVLAVENRRRAGERLFQAATALVCRHALEHLVGRAADELGGAAPRVRFVGRVHVAVAPVAPEHARR